MALILSDRLILASASPRRAELLSLLGLAFEVLPGHVDETFHGEDGPEEYVLRLAVAKAETVSNRHPEAWVIGADTAVVVSGRVLGKPADREDARNMLHALSGREHLVHTGFAVARGGRALRKSVETSAVRFREIAGDEAQWYARGREPYDKAGAYAVQGIGAAFVREIRGSCTNVIGLPVGRVLDALVELGAASRAEEEWHVRDG